MILGWIVLAMYVILAVLLTLKKKKLEVVNQISMWLILNDYLSII